jgi:hypothetical protein
MPRTLLFFAQNPKESVRQKCNAIAICSTISEAHLRRNTGITRDFPRVALG